jgi:serine/threonine-protein kinase
MGARAAARRMLASISVERETDLEMSMGESSVLLGLAALHDALAPLKDGDLVTTVRAQGDVLRDRIWQALGPALDTSASGALRFLGLAHGWAGVFYATLRWSAATGAAPPEPLREHLSLLGKLAVNDGAGLGWPISRQTDAPAWPGWCHGSAGYALLWSLAASQFGDERFIELAEAAAEHSWAHRGGLSATLCCGLAGQGLAMLVLARQVDATRWRKRAHSLALAAMSSPLVARLSASEPTPSAHVEQEPLHSLFKGAVGPALLAAELEHDAIPDWPFCSAWR